MARSTATEWLALVSNLEDREEALLMTIATRLWRGQASFGPLSHKKKEWVKEALEEVADGMVYIGAALQDIADDEANGSDRE